MTRVSSYDVFSPEELDEAIEMMRRGDLLEAPAPVQPTRLGDLEMLRIELVGQIRRSSNTLGALCAHLVMFELTEAEMLEVCDSLEDVLTRLGGAFDAITKIANAR